MSVTEDSTAPVGVVGKLSTLDRFLPVWIAAAISGQALAGVVGPLIEVPVLVGLVYVSLALRRRFTTTSTDLMKTRP